MRCAGQLDGPEYFQHGVTGHIILPPGDSGDPNTLRYAVERIKRDPRYRDYEHKQCTTLREIDALTDRLAAQLKQEHEREGVVEERVLEEKNRLFRDRMATRLASSATTEFEKEFIRLYMQLRDENKREKYRQRFVEYQAFFMQREYDNAHTIADRVLGS